MFLKYIYFFLILTSLNNLVFAENSSSIRLQSPDSISYGYEYEYTEDKSEGDFNKKLIIVVANDAISANLSDRHLSSQLRIGAIVNSVPEPLQKYISEKNYLVMTLTHEVYTPEDIESFELIEDDRPYAGWLYLTLGKINQEKDQLKITTIDLGIVGPSSGAKDLQENFHSAIESSNPNGWQHQLQDELSINIHHDRYYKTQLYLSELILSLIHI